MQSAFVEIGLERDAFLYVSDFFDEEEELERIVMEKSKKSTPEDAKREADDRIQRARLEREKQMEAVQDSAEPLSESGVDVSEADESEFAAPETAPVPHEEKETSRRDRKGRRGGKEKVQQPEPELAPEPIFEFDDFGFERIVDDETGDMFKDAYRQEAIIDTVRAVEFDMESTAAAEVGSLLGSVTEEP